MNSDRLRLTTPLVLPSPGRSVRAVAGNCELVFEAVRGGYALLWHAGREARRHVLGLLETGHLSLELRPPQLPVRLLLRETITLAPGARIRGYVQVPLVPTLEWRDDSRESVRLLEFTPASLAAEWDTQKKPAGAAIYTSTSSWFVRYPVHGGEARTTVPLHLKNASENVCSPGHLSLAIAADELAELRAGIGAVPRRMTWDGSRWHTAVKTCEVPV